MKSVLEYINESIEDGKYLDLPTQMYKQSSFNVGSAGPKPKQEYRMARRPGDKKPSIGRYTDEQYASMLARWEESNAKVKAKQKEADNAWKKYIESVKKINEENFEILIDKMLKVMEDKSRREDFIKKYVACILEDIKNLKAKGKDESTKTFIESVLFSNINSFRKSLELDNDSKIKGSWSLDSYEEDIYDNLYYWGSKYQIELPKWSKEREARHDLFSVSVTKMMDEWIEDNRRPGKKISDDKYSKQYEKFAKQIAKDKEKIAKFRAAWAKTDQYKNLVKIADMIEDDIETIEKTVNRAYSRFDELNGKDKTYRKAQEAVKETVNKWLDKAFGNTKHTARCWGKSLMDILVACKLAGEDDPEIEIMDKNTSSWMSGMRHSCKFKVTDSKGNEYETGKYEDDGFDSFGERPAGFGAWD